METWCGGRIRDTAEEASGWMLFPSGRDVWGGNRVMLCSRGNVYSLGTDGGRHHQCSGAAGVTGMGCCMETEARAKGRLT